jgi:hypothetical protein
MTRFTYEGKVWILRLIKLNHLIPTKIRREQIKETKDKRKEQVE